jgi:outer membrane lipoprotein-sorting protein
MALSDLTSGRGRRRVAWAVPLVVAGGVAAAVALSTATTSGAAPNLAPRTAQQLLVAVQEHAATALSGQVHESLDLGLPTLPGDASPASLSWQSLVAASHTMRVWVDGVDKQRIALLGQLSEADVVHNGDQVWTYTSDTNSVSHSITRPAGKHGKETKPDSSAMERYTPAGAAAAALKAIRPSTHVAVERSQRVAGRDAYTLVLSPKDPNSTVNQIRIAVDAHRFVPLRFEVLARGSSTPVFDTAFTKISYAIPSAKVFDFHRPAGAATSTNPLAPNRRYERGYTGYTPLPSAQGAHRPTMIGSGWTTVAELDAASASGLSGGLLSALTNPVGSTGSRLLHTTLVNALFTPDGRAFVGAVSPAYLERVAAAHPH